MKFKSILKSQFKSVVALNVAQIQLKFMTTELKELKMPLLEIKLLPFFTEKDAIYVNPANRNSMNLITLSLDTIDFLKD